MYREWQSAIKFITCLKANFSIVITISIEKTFTVHAVLNDKNDRFISLSKADFIRTVRIQHRTDVMALGFVASNGKNIPMKF